MTEPQDGGQNGPGDGGQDGRCRDGRLGWFAMGGQYDQAAPDGQMITALEEMTGPGRRPPAEATLDEVTGMLISWAAAEAHACAGKLAAVREIIRREGSRDPGPAPHGLPADWDIGVAHEIAAALGMSWQAAEPLAGFAWELEARLPRVGSLLDEGILNWQKAKIITDEFSVLGDDLIGKAETILLDRILDEHGRLRADMTPARLRRLCQQIVAELDPDGCAERREAAERAGARVRFFQQHGGAGALFAEGIPADDALRSEANIAKRAEEYRNAGIHPGDTMDLLRVLALIDAINGRSLDDRIAIWNAGQDEPTDSGHAPDDDREPGGGTPAGRPDPGLPSLIHLTLPLATLEERAQRPGEATGYGALDPALVRRIGEAAAASPRSQFCLTITDPDGYAAYHGCARLIRGTGTRPTGNTGGSASRDGPPPRGWDLAPDRTRAGPGTGQVTGNGAWILTVPGGRRYRVDLHKVPVRECDHQYETGAYRPSDLLRHLVQVRDGECTSVSCSMPAWRCDFDHVIPYDQGGRTDGCNAGMRSRRCHQVKQRPGWEVTESRPGWHRWTAPSGRAYVKGPMRYPS
jgi:hypothetical protein